MSCGIYEISLVDGRCYVGQSVTIEKRWASHRSRLRRSKHHSPHLQNAWNKYGEDAFSFSILEVCESWLLAEREEFWMAELDSVFCAGAAGPSPMAGRIKSPEHCAKLSESLRGHPVTDEARSKMRESTLRLWDDPIWRANVIASMCGRVPWNKGTASAVYMNGDKHPLYPKMCEQCSADFLGRKESKFCSRRCGAITQHARAKEA